MKTVLDFDLVATGTSTCPLGMPMCQNRLAIPMWSYAMEKYPPKRIIEIGTYGGGFITALAVHAWNISCEVITYDRMVAPDERFAEISHFLGIRFRTTDIWEAASEIAELIAAPGVTYVLCDGGDKIREMNTFARYLKIGDVIAAHDYDPDGTRGCGAEIDIDDVDAVGLGLVPFFRDELAAAAWLSYRRTRIHGQEFGVHIDTSR